MRVNVLLALMCLLPLIGCTNEAALHPTQLTVGTMTVDAEISSGTRFNVYCNNAWKAPETEVVVAGERAKYSFRIPNDLTSLRFDPSEQKESRSVIYSIVLYLPDMSPRKLPLASLRNFFTHDCELTVGPEYVTVVATGSELYFMSAVDPKSYPLAKTNLL